MIPVVLYHAGFAGFRGGFLGVDVFFVISGYLITRLIDAEMQGGEFSVVRFYERRVRRILPALYFVVVVSSVFAWLWLFPHELKDFGHSVVAIALFGSNVYFNQGIGYFTSDVELWPLIHTWSLAVEEQFYAAFPFLLLLLRRAARQMDFRRRGGAVGADARLGAMGVAASTRRPISTCRSSAPGSSAPARWSRWRRRRSGASARGCAGAWPDSARPCWCLSFAFAPEGPDAEPVVARAGRRDGAADRLRDARQRAGAGCSAPSRWSASASSATAPISGTSRCSPSRASASTRRRRAWRWRCSASLLSRLAYVSWRFVERPFRDRRRFSRTCVFAAALVVGVGADRRRGGSMVIEHGFPARMASYRRRQTTTPAPINDIASASTTSIRCRSAQTARPAAWACATPRRTFF